MLSRVGPERRTYAVGVNNVAYVAGAFAGPLLAGVLADALGVRVALAGFAVAASLSAVYLVRNVPAGPRYAKSAPVWASLIGLPRLIRTRRLGSPLLLVLADITILHIWLVYLPLYFTSRHGFSLTAAGALISVEALSYAIAQPYWGRLLDRRGYRAPVYLSLLAHVGCASVSCHWFRGSGYSMPCCLRYAGRSMRGCIPAAWRSLLTAYRRGSAGALWDLSPPRRIWARCWDRCWRVACCCGAGVSGPCSHPP